MAHSEIQAQPDPRKNPDPQLQISDPLRFAVKQRDRDIFLMVRDALANKRAMLAYQPVVQTLRTDRPAFYEALIRIQDRTGRIIPARQFIDAVEDTKMGRAIDRLALELGLQALHQVPSLRLAVNMSAQSIGSRHWMNTLNKGLAGDPTIGERLILEITERSAMVLPDKVRWFMEQLQSRGISFALDDFGTGYTALRYLKDFYFDILKIDGQFIKGIHSDPDNQALTKSILAIARHFEMYTVAEAVENGDDAAFLADSGVDCMQGYYFGVPTIRPYWMQDHDQARCAS